MIEVWIGAIVATTAGCIFAAWGPKALLKVMGITAILIVGGYIWKDYTDSEYRNWVYASHCFNLPDAIPGDGNYYSPADCRKAGGVPYADFEPANYKKYHGDK